MHGSGISIWFFNGVLMTIYGALIFGYGLFEVVTGVVAKVQLAYLHAPIWWGALMLTIGIFYLVKFRPGRKA
jgi:uncharacterized membrane protein